jgi:ATP-dependent RNA circularization protein (DNA/RNA ligase family)
MCLRRLLLLGRTWLRRSSSADRSAHIQALGRAVLAGLVEAVKDLVSGAGPILAAWEAYQAALRPEDLPSQVQEVLQRMRQDYQQLLAPELRAQAKETVTVALREAISILDEVGLSPEELATEVITPLSSAR